MLSAKKSVLVITIVAMAVVAVISVGLVLNRFAQKHLIEMQMVYEDTPPFISIDNPAYINMIWDDTAYFVTSVENYKRGKEIGYAANGFDAWRVYEIEGYGRDYLLVTNDNKRFVMSSNIQLLQRYTFDSTPTVFSSKLISITLYNDGTARIARSLLSSTMLLDSTYYYAFSGDELLIHYKSGDLFAKFDVFDENTLIFKEPSLAWMSYEGARFISPS